MCLCRSCEIEMWQIPNTIWQLINYQCQLNWVFAISSEKCYFFKWKNRSTLTHYVFMLNHVVKTNEITNYFYVVIFVLNVAFNTNTFCIHNDGLELTFDCVLSFSSLLSFCFLFIASSHLKFCSTSSVVVSIERTFVEYVE